MRTTLKVTCLMESSVDGRLDESRWSLLYEWYVENGDTRTLANLQVLQSKLNHPRQ